MKRTAICQKVFDAFVMPSRFVELFDLEIMGSYIYHNNLVTLRKLSSYPQNILSYSLKTIY